MREKEEEAEEEEEEEKKEIHVWDRPLWLLRRLQQFSVAKDRQPTTPMHIWDDHDKLL